MMYTENLFLFGVVEHLVNRLEKTVEVNLPYTGNNFFSVKLNIGS